MKMNRDQLVAGGVALAAFACSATHIYEVAKESGNHAVIAAVHPIGLDGLIYIGMRAVAGGRKWQGWLATTYGVGMSLTFNAVSYAHIAMPAWVMAVAMPVALVLGVLVVGHGPRDTAPDVPAPRVKRVPAAVRMSPPNVPVSLAVSQPDVPMSLPSVPAVPAPEPVSRRTWDMALARKLLTEGELSRKDIAERVGCSRKSIDRLAAQGVEE